MLRKKSIRKSIKIKMQSAAIYFHSNEDVAAKVSIFREIIFQDNYGGLHQLMWKFLKFNP